MSMYYVFFTAKRKQKVLNYKKALAFKLLFQSWSRSSRS